MTLCGEFEASILVNVVIVLGIPVLPLVVAGVGVDITTWVVSVRLSSVQVYMCSMSIITAGIVRTTCCSMFESTVLTIPLLTIFTAGCRLVLGPLTAHTLTL